MWLGTGLLGGLVLALLSAGSEPDGLAPPPEGWQVSPRPVVLRPPGPLPAAPDGGTTADDDAVPVEVWQRLADCESGDWDRHGEPKPDTARWDYGLEFDHGDHFEGGLNFHPQTWDTYRDPDMPPHAGEATRTEEIEVAERVLEDQGWRAWPVCSQVVDTDA